MSSIYVSEPPTKGKVILKTTYGPLDIELWPKEAPKASRNFVQLCVDGYYDNTIFHRIIKPFMVQAGDPTGTGTGCESIYGGVFADELHSRLRFNHRGLVACANTGTPNSNGSQFFITLDRCDWLDKKNTIFGKVTGDSLYNLLSLGDIETDKDDRPLESPPKIISVEVLWNPFDDIVPRIAPAKSLTSSTVDTSSRDTKKKATKKVNLLSFGEEAEEEKKELAAVKTEIKSSHDVLDNPLLLKDENQLSSPEVNAVRDLQLSVRETLSLKKEELRKESAGFYESLDHSDDDDANFDTRMRLQILQKRKEFGDVPHKQKLHNDGSSPRKHETSPPRSKSNGEDFDDRPKVEKLSLKKKGIGSEARAERMANADVDLQLLGDVERERQLQKQKRRRRQGHEEVLMGEVEKYNHSRCVPPKGVDGFRSAQEKQWYEAYFSSSKRPLAYNFAWKMEDLPAEALTILKRYNWDSFLAKQITINEDLVRIFYASLIQCKGEKHIFEFYVRGVRITFQRKDLACWMGNLADPTPFVSLSDEAAFDLDTLIEYLAPGEVWTKKIFRSAAMRDLPRLLHYINVHCLMVTNNRSEVRHKHAVFLYALLKQSGDINLPAYFMDQMYLAAKEKAWNFSLPLPGVVTHICRLAKCPEYSSDRIVEPKGLLTRDNIKRCLTHYWGEPTVQKRPRIVIDDEETELRRVEQHAEVPTTFFDARFAAFEAQQDQRWKETQMRWATLESRLDRDRSEQRQEFLMMQAMMRDLFVQQQGPDATLPPHFRSPYDPTFRGSTSGFGLQTAIWDRGCFCLVQFVGQMIYCIFSFLLFI